jgi:hypothetical protein
MGEQTSSPVPSWFRLKKNLHTQREESAGLIRVRLQSSTKGLTLLSVLFFKALILMSRQPQQGK